MDATPLNIGFGLIIVVALVLFLRAWLRGSRMLRGHLDKRTAAVRQAHETALRRPRS